jgi:hypothetical protein
VTAQTIAPTVQAARELHTAVDFAERAVQRARQGDIDVIHAMTSGLDVEGLRTVVAVLVEAFAGATTRRLGIGIPSQEISIETALHRQMSVDRGPL